MSQFLGNDFNKETDDAVYFYTPVYYVLDNFSAHTVEIWGKKFQTSEHAYQWKKFVDALPDVAQQIYDAPSPNEAKKVADAHKDNVPPDFFSKRAEIMKEVLRAKAHQHEIVRTVLEKTGSKKIIENSPIDSYWGAGPEGKGENTLGRIWMNIRDTYNR